MIKTVQLFLFILLSGLIVSGCRSSKYCKSCYVIISPMGISDKPRDTLVISTNPSDFQPKHFSIYNILTDERTLEYTISFITKYRYKSISKEEMLEYGAFDISVLENKSILTEYILNRKDSNKFLSDLISKLAKRKAKEELIKKLQQSLDRIKT
ncbi:MAG: hypothetical protein ABIN95_13585 [Mucilaginibacter sp.]